LFGFKSESSLACVPNGKMIKLYKRECSTDKTKIMAFKGKKLGAS